MDFVCKVMSPLFNTLSGIVTAFFQVQVSFNFMAAALSAVILEPKKIKYSTVSTFSPFIRHEVMGPDAMIFIFLNVQF